MPTNQDEPVSVSDAVKMGASEEQVEFSENITRDWSMKEEKRAKLKLDLILMPLLVLGFLALQMDRGNISNALTSTLVKDVGLKSDEVNDGNQLQLAAIVVFEIPFNMVLAKFGPQYWLTGEAFAWGLVALFQAFITNKSSFYATRFLLGMFEAGYLPGSMLLLSTFYTRDEIALRTTIFYIGNYLSQGIGSLVAAGVFELSGKDGLGGWQWLFIIDGLFTVLAAVAFFFFLPASPQHTMPICHIKAFDFYTERERHILHNRILLDDIDKSVPLTAFTFREFMTVFFKYRLWGHLAINLVGIVPKGGLQLYSPTIIKSLGFTTTKANALASVSNYGVIVLAMIGAWISDATRKRGLVCLLGLTYSLIFAGVQYSLATGSGKWTKYAIFTLLSSGNAIFQGINDAWFSSNARSHKERCVGLALCVMGSNLGGLAGQQLFRSSDAPAYKNAFLAVLCCYAGAMVLVGWQMVVYIYENRKTSKEEERSSEVDPSQPRQRKMDI